MPKSNSQKMKILYLMDFLLKNTDENHAVSMNDIISYLSSCDIKAERKSVYDDIESLRLYGLDIIGEKNGTSYNYYIGSREFELAELLLLADCVEASKFITGKKSASLIKKLEQLTSIHYAHELQRQVFISERVKAVNETIYYNIDKIHAAITKGRKIAFKYYEYLPDKTRQLKNDGNDYIVSPYSLTVSEENYYLVAHSPRHSRLTHYRVDKMADIRITEEKQYPINEVLGENFNLGDYCKKVFNMYGGDTVRVTLECDNSLINAVIDRFGENVPLRNFDGKFEIDVSVNVSPTFFAWVFMFEGKMKIISPANIHNKFISVIQSFL